MSSLISIVFEQQFQREVVRTLSCHLTYCSNYSPAIRETILLNDNFDRSSDHPAEIAELLRDLWALKHEKKSLSQIEEEALRRLTDSFVTEWAISMDQPSENVRQEFNELLYKGQTKA